jgi:hypothetical protein
VDKADHQLCSSLQHNPHAKVAQDSSRRYHRIFRGLRCFSQLLHHAHASQRTRNGRMLASARDSLGRTGELGPRAIVGAFLTRKTNLAVLALQALLPQGRRIVAYPDRAPSSALEFAPEDFKAISNELRVVGACSAWQSCDHAPVAAGTFLFHHEMPRTNSLTIDVDRRRKRPPRF